MNVAARDAYFQLVTNGRIEPGAFLHFWSDEAFRKSVVYDLVRSLSKEGTLRRLSWVGALRSLPATELVHLYCQIRDQSRRYEIEWREEYEQMFPICIDALPLISEDDLLRGLSVLLAFAIGQQDVNRVSDLIRIMRHHSLSVYQLVHITEESARGEWYDLEFEEVGSPSGVDLLTFASRVGSTPIINLLTAS